MMLAASLKITKFWNPYAFALVYSGNVKYAQTLTTQRTTCARVVVCLWTMTEAKMGTCIANLGDVDWLSYGGFMVFDDGDIEVIYEPPEDAKEEIWEVYRFEAERFKLITDDELQGYLVPYEYDKSTCIAHGIKIYEPWFASYLPEVASSVGGNTDDLRGALLMSNPLTRAFTYRDMIGYFGAYEFDQYPMRFSRDEMEEHGKERGYICRGSS